MPPCVEHCCTDCVTGTVFQIGGLYLLNMFRHLANHTLLLLSNDEFALLLIFHFFGIVEDGSVEMLHSFVLVFLRVSNLKKSLQNVVQLYITLNARLRFDVGVDVGVLVNFGSLIPVSALS